MHSLSACGKYVLAGAGALAALASLGTAHAGFTVLHAFTGAKNDGAYPEARLTEDSAGSFYGTTWGGGAHRLGTVFKLAPDGTETVLYAFAGGNDGAEPGAGLVEDKTGNFYGTTVNGGTDDDGTVFKLASDGTETVLHIFTGGGNDGFTPFDALIRDKAGNLYGTTANGGPRGFGTAFKLAPDGAETVLCGFAAKDGAYPVAGLIQDKAGNLYGTTLRGGTDGNGILFKIAPNGTETILHAFRGGKHGDGGRPYGGLIHDKAGNLYSTTAGGSGIGCHDGYGCGTVFKLVPDGTELILYAFRGHKHDDGARPEAGLIQDEAGNLFGTTARGGTYGSGTVFKLTPHGKEKTLHAFSGGSDGAYPYANLIEDKAGNLYGTTSAGGSRRCEGGCGTVFRIKE